MFKKIISQLSFSPALVGQLGFYAKRLRKEQATRRIGLIFVALALVVQSLVVFQAPEPANASNNNDMVIGGLGLGSNRSLDKFLAPYDRNERYLQDIMNYFGISRQEIVNTQFGQFRIGGKKSYGFENRAGSTALTITNSNWQPVTTLYGRPLDTAWGNDPNSYVYAYMGYSSRIGWFAIMQSCGNLVTDVYPQPPVPPTPANITGTKSAINTSQGNVDASKVAAKVNDRITYTVSVRNTGQTAGSITMTDNISQVLNYAKLTDPGGGTLNAATGILSWGAVSVGPGQTISKSYSVQMNSSLISNTTPCSMKNTFLTSSVTVPVDCKKPPANIDTSKSAINVTQKNVDATKTTARANDVITYTVKVANTGGTAADVAISDDLSDVLKYTTLSSNGGGNFDDKTKMLSWGTVAVEPGKTVSKTYSVKLNASLISPTLNCSMKNDFLDKSVVIGVGCSTPPANIGVEKTAMNVSQGNVNATTVTAKENDRITFTLTAKNTGGTAKDFTFTDTLSDALEYAKLIDNGGGTFDDKAKTLSWPVVNLKPGAKEVRTFTMQILATIPATPTGISDPSSYDCKIENTFYAASVVIPVTCAAPKIVENVTQLPHTGPAENMIFAGVLFAVVVFFYLRSRQLGAEVRLIRRDLNGGTI